LFLSSHVVVGFFTTTATIATVSLQKTMAIGEPTSTIRDIFAAAAWADCIAAPAAAVVERALADLAGSNCPFETQANATSNPG
jgi:hypothetical protein